MRSIARTTATIHLMIHNAWSRLYLRAPNNLFPKIYVINYMIKAEINER